MEVAMTVVGNAIHSATITLATLAASPVLAGIPSTAEAIAAIRASCTGLREPIRQVRCQDFGADEPTEAVCSYQVGGKKSRKDKTYFAVDGNGWHLIDEPIYCPKSKQGIK